MESTPYQVQRCQHSATQLEQRKTLQELAWKKFGPAAEKWKIEPRKMKLEQEQVCMLAALTMWTM